MVGVQAVGIHALQRCQGLELVSRITLQVKLDLGAFGAPDHLDVVIEDIGAAILGRREDIADVKLIVKDVKVSDGIPAMANIAIGKDICTGSARELVAFLTTRNSVIATAAGDGVDGHEGAASADGAGLRPAEHGEHLLRPGVGAREIGIGLRQHRGEAFGQCGVVQIRGPLVQQVMRALQDVYANLMSVGADHKLRDFGMLALESMRLEKGYRSWKGDLSSDYTMFENALERWIDFDKPHFVGRDALIAERDLQPGANL